MEINSELLVFHTKTLKEAMEQLNINVQKLVFVIDEHYILLGSLSDGDIRRALLNGLSLESNVTEAMNAHPRTLSISDYQNADHTAKDISEHVPVIDQNGKIKTLISKDLETPLVNHKNTVLLMAGGFGKRLLPLTKNCPKPMLMLNGKPILLHIINKFKKQGFKNFLISTYYLPEVIEDFFKDGSEFGVSINYLREDKPMGTGGCLKLLTEVVNYPILLANGDVLSDMNYCDILVSHWANDSIATMVVKNDTLTIPFGVIETCNLTKKIQQLSEKPTMNFLVNTGVYCLSRSAIDAAKAKADAFLDMPDLLSDLILKNHTVKAYEFSGYWEDLGTIEALKRVESQIR